MPNVSMRSVCALLLLATSAAHCARASYPQVYWFRNERYLQALSPEQALRELGSCQGVILKLLYEEFPRGFDAGRLLRICRAYKEKYPDRFVLIHFNLRERLRDGERALFTEGEPGESPPVFPAHWAYFPGARLRSGIAANTATIPVDDASRFRATDDVRVVGPGDLQQPSTWRENELVKVVSIDAERSCLEVRRGRRHTMAQAWPAGAHLLPHYRTGWGHPGLYWVYNMTRSCPPADDWLPLNYRLARQLATEVKRIYREAGTEVVDGFEFDVTTHLFGAPEHCAEILQRGQPMPGKGDRSRHIDADLDGAADDACPDGMPGWGLGGLDFCRELRRQLPDAILIGDIIQTLWRPLPYIDGFDNESFPDIRKAFRWSGAFERSADVLAHLTRPPVAHFFTRADMDRLPLQKDAYQTIRLSLGAALLLGIGHSVSSPKSITGRADTPFLTDLHTGSGGGPGWLGAPQGPCVRVDASAAQPSVQVRGPRPEDVHLTSQSKGYSVSGPTLSTDHGGRKSLRIDIRSVPRNRENEHALLLRLRPSFPARAGREYTLRIALRAESVYARLHEGHTGIPFGVWLGYDGAHRPGKRAAEHRLLVFPQWRTYHLTYAPFENEKALGIRVELGGEPGSLWVGGWSVTAGGGDVFYRRFERGLVLVNATRQPRTFDLSTIAPGVRFRHLQATRKGDIWLSDPKVNDGSAVGSPAPYAVPPMDARILAVR